MDFKNKSTERLNSELKTLKMITGALIGVLTVLFAVTIYGLLTKENNSTFIALIAVPFSLSAIILLNFGIMKKINKELDSRSNG